MPDTEGRQDRPIADGAASSAIDICRVVRDALTAGDGADPERVSLRPMLHRTEGIYIRQAPSVPVTEYMDGSKDVAAMIEVYVRSSKEDEALATAQWCSDTIRAADLSSRNDSYQFTSVSEAVGATLQSLPTDGMYTYMVTMRVDMTIA